MKEKLWISWGIWAVAAIVIGIYGNNMTVGYVCAFISAGFGFAAFLFGDKL